MESICIYRLRLRPDAVYAVERNRARAAERARRQLEARRFPSCGVGGFDLVHCYGCGYRGTWLLGTRRTTRGQPTQPPKLAPVVDPDPSQPAPIQDVEGHAAAASGTGSWCYGATWPLRSTLTTYPGTP